MQDLLCNDVFVGDLDTDVGLTHATPTGSRLLAGVVKRKEKVIFKKDSEDEEDLDSDVVPTKIKGKVIFKKDEDEDEEDLKVSDEDEEYKEGDEEQQLRYDVQESKIC